MARPYICRLSALIRLTPPSTAPEPRSKASRSGRRGRRHDVHECGLSFVLDRPRLGCGGGILSRRFDGRFDVGRGFVQVRSADSDRLLDGVAQVLPQVPPIGDLDGPGCSVTGALGVGAGTTSPPPTTGDKPSQRPGKDSRGLMEPRPPVRQPGHHSDHTKITNSRDQARHSSSTTKNWRSVIGYAHYGVSVEKKLDFDYWTSHNHPIGEFTFTGSVQCCMSWGSEGMRGPSIKP